MKRITFLLFIALSIQLYAREETIFSVGNLYYRVTSALERTVEVTSTQIVCGYYSGDIVVPDSVEYNGMYYKVTALGAEAFHRAIITSMVLPSGIQTIGEYCFSSASLPVSLTLPDSLKTLKYGAFCNAMNVVNISIPSTTDNIGIRALSIAGLQSIIVDTASKHYMSIEGVLYSKDTTKLLQCPAAKTGTFTIPNGVKYIEELAFEVSKLQTIIIPNGVNIIKSCAFSECDNLRNLNIPASVTNIGGGAFRRCISLTNLMVDTLNSNYKLVDKVLYSIEMDTLKSYTSAKDTVYICEGVKVVDMYSLAGLERVKHVVFPKSVKKILEGAFMNTYLQGIVFPPHLEEIGMAAFKGCSKLRSGIVIPNSVKTIGVRAFTATGITSVVMSDSVKTIPAEAFMYCTNLNSYSGGASVERIEEYAFSDCGSFAKNIVFPPSLRVIEDAAFLFTDVITVEFTGMVDTIGQSNFGDILKLTLVNPTPPYSKKPVNSCNSIIIPCGATSAYMSDPNWSSYNYEEDCGGVEEIDPQSTVQVVAQHHAIEVHNAEEYAVAIYDVMGRCHAAEPATGQSLRHYPLPTAGVYVVHINGKGYKVVVR